MPNGCNFPEHHHGSSGGGFPFGLLIIVAGIVAVGTSTAFAQVVHEIMILVLGICIFILALAAGGAGLYLHRRREMRPPRPIINVNYPPEALQYRQPERHVIPGAVERERRALPSAARLPVRYEEDRAAVEQRWHR